MPRSLEGTENDSVDHAERVAQALVESVVSGSRMVYRVDQSRSVHDFDLHYPDGRASAAEVTASVNEAGQRTNAAILDKKRGGPAVKTTLCKKDWYIHPESGAIIKKIRQMADEYLAAVESAGIETFLGPSDRWEYPSVERIYSDLSVFSGAVIAWKEPGYMRIAPPGGGGAVAAPLVLEAVKREAFKEDNRRKLGAASADERHLLVYVHPRNFLPWCALVDFEPPPELPELPPEITDVWAFGETRSENEYVIWRASVTSPWRRLGRVTATLRTH